MDIRTELRDFPDLLRAWTACENLMDVLSGYRAAAEPGTDRSQLCCLLTAMYQDNGRAAKAREAVAPAFSALAGEARDFGTGWVATSAAKCLSHAAGQVQSALRLSLVEYAFDAAIREFRQTDASGYLDFYRGLNGAVRGAELPGAETTGAIIDFWDRLAASGDFWRYARHSKPDKACEIISRLTGYGNHNIREYLEAEFLRAARKGVWPANTPAGPVASDPRIGSPAAGREDAAQSPPPEFLGLEVNRDARTVSRPGERYSLLPDPIRLPPRLWHLFVRLFDAGESGATDAELRKDYRWEKEPGNWRGAFVKLREALENIDIGVSEPDRERKRRLEDNAPPGV